MIGKKRGTEERKILGPKGLKSILLNYIIFRHKKVNCNAGTYFLIF